MDGALCCFLSHGLIQTAIQGRAVITSLVEYALSLCGVTFRDTHRASRASFHRPYHNQRVELRLCRQRVKQQETWLGTTLPRSRLLTVNRHVVCVLTSCPVLTNAMNSCWCSIRAVCNVSSSTAYCVLNIWQIARFNNSNHRLASYDVFIQTSSTFFPQKKKGRKSLKNCKKCKKLEIARKNNENMKNV